LNNSLKKILIHKEQAFLVDLLMSIDRLYHPRLFI
jgi:hypothetical protein